MEKLKRLFDRQTLILAILIFIAGLFLRFWALPSRFIFGGDESYLIWEVWNLANGHLPLVGFEAGGVGGIKLLPYLLYFLAGPFLFFAGHPLFIEATLAAFGVLRGVLFYLIGRNVFNHRVGIFAALIYLISERANTIDRKFFGATFLILSSLLVFYFLVKTLKEKQIKILDLVILSSIIGLSFSAHYQSFFLFLGSIVFLLFLKKSVSAKQIGIFTASTLIWFTPLVLFEFRHNFSITKRFFALSGEATTISSSSFATSAQYLLQQFYGFLASPVYKIPLVDILPQYFFWSAFLVIFALIFLLSKSKQYLQFKPVFIYFGFMIFAAFISLSFVQRPHYDIDPYYWFLIPIFIFLMALLFDFLFIKKTVFLGILLFGVFTTYNLLIFFIKEIPDTYQVKNRVVTEILDDIKLKQLGGAIIKFEISEAGAFDYLFYYQAQKRGLNPENLQLITPAELFQERLLLGGRRGPVQILSRDTAANLTPNYLVISQNERFDNFSELAKIPPYSIQVSLGNPN